VIHVFCNLEEDDETGRLPMCNMTFEIVGKTFDESRQEWTIVCRADGSPAGTVGFEATIPMSGWDEQVNDVDGEAFHSFWGPVWLRSRGAESDVLLALVADYYEIPRAKSGGSILGFLTRRRAQPWRFVREIQCLAVGINSDPSLLGDEPIDMKLFFDENREGGRYAEVFLNVDLQRGCVWLNEKDEEYRSDLVHWLSLTGPVNANPYGDTRRAA
jgi:hypothetical protein